MKLVNTGKKREVIFAETFHILPRSTGDVVFPWYQISIFKGFFSANQLSSHRHPQKRFRQNCEQRQNSQKRSILGVRECSEYV